MDMTAFSVHSSVGIGLRSPHVAEILRYKPKLGWLEVHTENWMAAAGPIAETLQDIRCHYPLSLHGVGLSLGSADGIDPLHLKKLRNLVELSRPILVSEHLSWGAVNGHHSNDLLPLPYNSAAVDTLSRNIDRVQQALGRRLLVENISSYCTFAESEMPEWEFVVQTLERADCNLLLDLNNLYVNARNQGFAAHQYLDNLPLERVAEIHLAGFEQAGGVVIDTHARPVQPAVWELFDNLLSRMKNKVPVLIEWDNDLPTLSVLLEQARVASEYLQEPGYVVA